MTFLDQPLSHWAQRTSKDVCRDACAIQAFKRRTVPLHVWAMSAIGVVGAVLIYFTR
jgi:hypothetical protein